MINEECSFDLQYFNKLKREISFTINRVGIITYIDSNIENILGYKVEELINRSLYEFISKQAALDLFSSKNLSVNNIEVMFKHKNNDDAVYMDVNYQYIIDTNDKSIVGAYGTMLDVTKYKEQEKKLELLNEILGNSKDILYRYLVVPERKFVYISKAVESILERSLQEYFENPMHVFETAHPDDVIELEKKLMGQVNYLKPVVTRWRHKDGHYIWMEDYPNPIYDDNGKYIGVEGVCRDISEKVELEKKLRFLTYYDSLTGVRNRMFFDEEIKKIDSEVDIPVGMISCDIDNLKDTNDNYGHNAGDTLIKKVATLLLKSITDDMFIARVGGDEFAIIIKNTSYCEVKKLCNDIKDMIDEHNSVNDCKVKVSIGYAFSEKSIGQMALLIKNADKRMYAEKAKHKKICFRKK